MKFECVDRETLFQGYFRVDRYHLKHELFNGGWTPVFTREVFDPGPRVTTVLLFDPQQDTVVLVEQFRMAPLVHNEDPWLIQAVAGVVEGTELPETTAKREAVEEAGCEVTELHPVMEAYLSCGCVSQKTWLYMGRCSAPESGSIHGIGKENEDIRALVMPASQALNLLYGKRIKDASTIILLQWFALHHTELRSRWLVSEASTPLI